MRINCSLQLQYDKWNLAKMILVFCLLFVGSAQLNAAYPELTLPSHPISGNLKPPDDQGVKITGVVRDASTKDVLIGVTVSVEGTTIGTITNLNGEFTLTVPSPTSVILFSYVGYSTLRVPLNGQTYLEVELEPATLDIDEVVVVGYGTQKKATVTGAITSIGKTELIQSPVASISNALVGRMPGLLSVQRYGRPGDDASTLRIRGFGTFTGVQDPLIMVDGIETSNYNNIDPNEIESISILKDASATAVYGVRGANGVLIITTKRGKISKPKVSYTAQYATSRFTGMLRGLNAYQYATGYNLARRYDGYITGGYTPAFSDEAIAHYIAHDDPIFYPDVDWYTYMFDKNSGQIQHNINIEGGTERVKYFASFGTFNQEGLIKHTDLIKDYDGTLRYKRYNIRSNFDFDITNRLSASVNVSSQIELRSGVSAPIQRVFEACWAGNPVSFPKPEDVGGRFVALDGVYTSANPISWLLFNQGQGFQKNYRNYLNSSVRLNYKFDFITEGLSSHATVSYNNYNMQNILYSKTNVSYKAKRLPDNSVIFVPQNDPTPFGFSESFDKNRKLYFEAGFDYERSFGSHNVTGLLLYNQSKRYDPNLAYLIPNGYQGIVGRVTYDFKGRYLAEVNMGYNGTENFAPGKRFGFFPAYSLGWVASEEPFFPQNRIVTYMKIRGSYGVVGNDQIGGSRFLYNPAAYTYMGNFYYFGEFGSNLQGYQGSIEGALGNPLVTWERAKKMNVAAEIYFLDNKIKITAEYFDENRDNILARRNTVPTIVAAQLPAYNIGKMSNSGYEGDISFNNKMGQLNYWIKANFSYAHNVIEFQDEVPQKYPYQKRTGQKFGQPFGLLTDGLFNSWEEVNDANRPVYQYQNNKIQPGDIKYVDVNGDGLINDDDMVPIGYPSFPEKMYGLSFGGNFKGFDLSVLFQGAANVSVTYSRSFVQPFLESRNAPNYMVESWSYERLINGQRIRFPRYNTGYSTAAANWVASNWWTRDASYVRLKNIEIGYSFPQQLIKKVGLDYLRLYVNGYNLYTWSKVLPGLDPESAPASSVNDDPYPVTRTINFGVNVKF